MKMKFKIATIDDYITAMKEDMKEYWEKMLSKYESSELINELSNYLPKKTKTVYITDDMYCTKEGDDLAIDIEGGYSHTKLSRGAACKLIKILSEYLLGMSSDLWGEAKSFPEPVTEDVEKIDQMTTELNNKVEKKVAEAFYNSQINKVESEIISTKDE